MRWNKYKTYYFYVVIGLLTIQAQCQDETPAQEEVEEQIHIENRTQNEEDNQEEVVADTPEILPSYLSVSEPEIVVTPINTTLDIPQNITQKYVACSPKSGSAEVEIVNGTQLIKLLTPDVNITSKDAVANCIAVLFYTTYCPFSTMAAPHFNALPRAFPDIKMIAIDAMKYHFFNAQNGIWGVPTLFLFHNGRSISKFNESEYTLELFSKFVTKYTGIKPEDKSYVTSADFSGPVVSSMSYEETDYYLGLSWSFILLCSVYYFSKSKWWEWIVETVKITWRESEAQHEHNE